MTPLDLLYANWVASFTDAWIETFMKNSYKTETLSHLLQMRGLKLILTVGGMVVLLSHLLQMRGLKPTFGFLYKSFLSSHLLQMRGLKLVTLQILFMVSVASFTDAWIETLLN